MPGWRWTPSWPTAHPFICHSTKVFTYNNVSSYPQWAASALATHRKKNVRKIQWCYLANESNQSRQRSLAIHLCSTTNDGHIMLLHEAIGVKKDAVCRCYTVSIYLWWTKSMKCYIEIVDIPRNKWKGLQSTIDRPIGPLKASISFLWVTSFRLLKVLLIVVAYMMFAGRTMPQHDNRKVPKSLLCNDNDTHTHWLMDKQPGHWARDKNAINEPFRHSSDSTSIL